MKHLVIVLAFVFISGHAWADCVRSSELLFKIRPFQCSELSMRPYAEADNPALRFQTADGLFIFGEIVAARSVIEPGLDPRDLEHLNIREVPAVGSSYRFFMSGFSNRHCPLVLDEPDQWFVTVFHCCDIWPPRGDCMVPFPIAKPEHRPGRWVNAASTE